MNTTNTGFENLEKNDSKFGRNSNKFQISFSQFQTQFFWILRIPFFFNCCLNLQKNLQLIFHINVDDMTLLWIGLRTLLWQFGLRDDFIGRITVIKMNILYMIIVLPHIHCIQVRNKYKEMKYGNVSLFSYFH